MLYRDTVSSERIKELPEERLRKFADRGSGMPRDTFTKALDEIYTVSDRDI